MFNNPCNGQRLASFDPDRLIGSRRGEGTLWPPCTLGGGEATRLKTLYLTYCINQTHASKLVMCKDAPVKAWCNVDNELFLTTKTASSRTENGRGKSVNNSPQDGRFNYATLCCRGQIIASQTSSLLQASCSTDKAGRHDVLCKVH